MSQELGIMKAAELFSARRRAVAAADLRSICEIDEEIARRGPECIEAADLDDEMEATEAEPLPPGKIEEIVRYVMRRAHAEHN